MRMLVALITLIALIACSTSAQACWPPANATENSADDAEPVKVAEPVDGEQDNEQDDATDEEEKADGSNDPEGTGEENIETATPIVDTVDQDVTEGSEVVEKPAFEEVAETVTTREIRRSSGYGEARVVEIIATAVQPNGTESIVVNNKSTSAVSGTNISAEQIIEVNTDEIGNGNNKNSSYATGVAMALIAMITGTAYCFRK